MLYFEWGNEEPGNVTVWEVGENGQVVIIGEIRKTELPETAVYDCPYP